MFLLQIYLLAGLILHKIIWEILRQKADKKPLETQSVKLRFIKAVKICILLGVIVQIWLPEVLPIADNPAILRIVGIIIYTFGLLTAIAARFQLGENWANIETGQILERQQVVAKGVYGFIRHPIYTGDLLLLLGLELTLNSWLVAGVLLLAPIVLRQAVKEERMLVRNLPGYDVYCARTKRFIPFVI
jgi:protein-S-isoprenylcysteine O-methyltransferase Ste14